MADSRVTGKLQKRMHDRRWRGVFVTMVGVSLIAGAIISVPDNRGRGLIGDGNPVVSSTPRQSPEHESGGDSYGSRTLLLKRLDFHYQRAVVMLHAGEYAYALVELNHVLEIAPGLPEAYVNMGFALLGLKRFTDAGEAFSLATEIRPEQANAYYGLAVALEASGDLPGAIGAMRTYLHRSTAGENPFFIKARSALWEWQDALSKLRTRESSGDTDNRSDRESGAGGGVG